jgi:hypothetical protein
LYYWQQALYLSPYVETFNQAGISPSTGQRSGLTIPIDTIASGTVQ